MDLVKEATIPPQTEATDDGLSLSFASSVGSEGIYVNMATIIEIDGFYLINICCNWFLVMDYYDMLSAKFGFKFVNSFNSVNTDAYMKYSM